MKTEEGAPCALDKRETSGDPANWPGSPCLIEEGLCLTCGQRERKEAMNISDKQRAWRDAADSGGLPEVRKALYEALDQLHHHLTSPAEEGPDLNLKHYIELGATVDALTASLEAADNAGRKTIKVADLWEIVGRAG